MKRQSRLIRPRAQTESPRPSRLRSRVSPLTRGPSSGQVNPPPSTKLKRLRSLTSTSTSRSRPVSWAGRRTAPSNSPVRRRRPWACWSWDLLKRAPGRIGTWRRMKPTWVCRLSRTTTFPNRTASPDCTSIRSLARVPSVLISCQLCTRASMKPRSPSSSVISWTSSSKRAGLKGFPSNRFFQPSTVVRRCSASGLSSRPRASRRSMRSSIVRLSTVVRGPSTILMSRHTRRPSSTGSSSSQLFSTNRGVPVAVAARKPRARYQSLSTSRAWMSSPSLKYRR